MKPLTNDQLLQMICDERGIENKSKDRENQELDFEHVTSELMDKYEEL